MLLEVQVLLLEVNPPATGGPGCATGGPGPATGGPGHATVGPGHATVGPGHATGPFWSNIALVWSLNIFCLHADHAQH